MSIRATGPAMIRTAAIAVAVGSAVLFGAAGQAVAEVEPGPYTSTTWSGGVVLLQRDARVEGGELVLIGRYPIHSTPDGGYVDIFPGHRVVMHSDGRGGYSGPAFFGGVEIGAITLTPR
ncbi:hypothetical protein NN3_02140 [Nocardia neocaledoniensis NBRC 108232]|uniref:MspA protein n=1 Tax=Nocardia neocaledoniensis TaxID=236511 RepID=A0A317NA73_9NOCA|nr:hypothetical protein [Nocardia neocaledoniensis]PWV71607.1 hypothetical protein DFR69_11091 [Nocardia neocaledoniensis]GEM29207.1 hypothetical protein NN3_02140 [Nocardia neocaledoniensis NBRC 108232]